MNEMKFVVYGVEVHSPVILPVSISSKGISSQVLRLQTHHSNKKKKVFKYKTPVAEIHGRITQLYTNIPFSSSRTLIERYWKINIEGLFSFVWGNDSENMIIEYENELDLEKLSFWLLHTIVPIYLMLKQSSLLLHASVVEVNEKVLLFVAPSFGGKSTLADFFIREGHSLLSDDKVRLEHMDENYFVYPSYPYRRPYREFEMLGKHTKYFSDRPLALGSIYFLNYVEPKDDCSIESIRGLHKFEILKNAYLYEPVSMSKIEMGYLMHLVKNSKVYQINMPKDLTRLSEVYDMILEHTRSDREFLL